ncbi:hypothetical protein ACEWY4_006267 [Coilia grayii]|uniref:Secretoneurin n=1 Tax=Coilia grayii TaxID=363190 RepID=A0ABD1KCY5_9TELE
MLLLPPRLSIGGVAVLLALLHACAVHGASIRHHRLRGGDPGTYFAPSSDMVKALEYIESLKRRTDGLESPTADYDEVDKFRFLVQLASLQDESAPERGDDGWLESKAPQWVKALLRALDQASENTEAGAPQPSRPSKNRQKSAGSDGAVGDYGGLVKTHKNYPLMFEDEENARDSTFKRATEDLDEQYTPQSLANMRSIFEELGKLSAKDQKRAQKFYSNDDEDEDDDDDDMYRERNLAYEDVTGGEDWVPLEEQLETEEVVKGSHEEFERGLGDSGEDVETIERRASQDPDDDTKLVDYYLLKVLEMSDQEAKREAGGQDNKKRFIRPPLIDPQAVNKLKAISLKMQIPPDELIEMLITGEIRKQERPVVGVERKPMPRYKGRIGKYYNRRLPDKFPNYIPPDFKAEDILNLLDSMGSQKYYPKQRPYKTTISRFVTPSGHRGSMIMSEMNKAPMKRKDDYDDSVDEDELTFLAAKVLTEYPDGENSKRAVQSEAQEQFPYELYEEAMKDYFDQVDTGKSAPVKRDTEAKEEAEAKKINDDASSEPLDQQKPGAVQEEEKEHRAKIVSGM